MILGGFQWILEDLGHPLGVVPPGSLPEAGSLLPKVGHLPHFHEEMHGVKARDASTETKTRAVATVSRATLLLSRDHKGRNNSISVLLKDREGGLMKHTEVGRVGKPLRWRSGGWDGYVKVW